MDDIKSLIDFFLNAILNIWNVCYTHGGIFFKVTIVIVFIFPLFNRIISTIITHGGFGLMQSGSIRPKSNKKSNKENK